MLAYPRGTFCVFDVSLPPGPLSPPAPRHFSCRFSGLGDLESSDMPWRDGHHLLPSDAERLIKHR